MFIVILTYTKPLEEVNQHVEAHRSFLDRYYAEGVLLVSGRQVPPQGGLMVARAESKEKLQDILKQDPYQIAGVASYEIIEFSPIKWQPELEPFVKAFG